MRVYGLIGHPLSHSFSPSYFRDKFEREGVTDAAYRAFPLKSVDQLPELLEKQRGIVGLNVTIPHKETVLPLLDELDPVAEQIGSVNTIVVTRDGGSIHTKGYNTDAIGFRYSLRPFLKGWHHKALILGTGGSSKAVDYVLREIGLETVFVSREPSAENQVSYDDLNEEAIAQFKLIVNTTPLGMYPKVNFLPDIPYAALGPEHLLYDLIYNPKETEFLRRGRSFGSPVCNGLKMLKMQADAAWEIWNR